MVAVTRPNGGAYAARNTGLDNARGELIAFYDSDDLWLPQHLQWLCDALVRHRDVDWAYAACRAVEKATGREIAPTTFVDHGRDRPFLALDARIDTEGFRTIVDSRVLACAIEHGLYAGLQNSVIRREVFEGRRFWPDYRVTEDVQFLTRQIAGGLRIGYVTDVSVVYRVHDDNSSASVAGRDASSLLPVFEEQARGLRALRHELALRPFEARALRRRLAQVLFWHLGYHGYLANGQRAEAHKVFREALGVWPWNTAMWKTFASTRLR